MDIQQIPENESIPIKWIQEKMLLADDAGDLDATDVLSWLIQTWIKEKNKE